MELAPYRYENLLMIPFQVGVMDNNNYLIADTVREEAVVIDSSDNFQTIIDRMATEGWEWKALWATHAHFDHVYHSMLTIAGGRNIPIAMHPGDEIIRVQRCSAREGFPGTIDCPEPQIVLADGMKLYVGDYEFIVYHTPGHSPGSVVYYCPAAGWLFTGDLVFYHDHGRTDLIGGSQSQIENSINTKVLSLPDETVIFPGHGQFTSVGVERPFFGQYF